MKRLLKAAGLIAILVIIGSGVSVYFAAKATQEVPEFYETAILDQSFDFEKTTEQLEAQIQRLTEDVQRLGRWEATFTTQQINAWLATQLDQQFPNILPKGTQDPRVMIEEGMVHVAAKYNGQQYDTVISIQLRAELTDQPNEVAVTVERLRAGALPIPISQFTDQIAKAASGGDFPIRWQEDAEVPVALVKIPRNHANYIETPVMIETFELRDGEVYLAGRTGPAALTAWIPNPAITVE